MPEMQPEQSPVTRTYFVRIKPEKTVQLCVQALHLQRQRRAGVKQIVRNGVRLDRTYGLASPSLICPHPPKVIRADRRRNNPKQLQEGVFPAIFKFPQDTPVVLA